MTVKQGPVRFGLVGCGTIADGALAPALRSVAGAVLWAVTSRDLEKAQAFAAKHGAQSACPAYDSYKNMLADPDLDAVIIATPDGLHAGQAIAAARAGKHVFVEKPMATNAHDANAMTEACRKAGVRLGVAYQNRWHVGHRLLADMLRSGGEASIGAIRHMRVDWSTPAPDANNWRAQDKVGRWWSMAALGSHCLDLVRWMMIPRCGEVVSIRAQTSDVAFKSGRDESASLTLRFASGAIADIFVSVVEQRRKRVEIVGEKSSVICIDTLGARGTGSIYVGSDGNVIRPMAFEPSNPYIGELNDFVSAVREGREPEVGGEEATRNVILLCMAEDDARRRP